MFIVCAHSIDFKKLIQEKDTIGYRFALEVIERKQIKLFL
jgi:hypothetical protein